MLVQIISDTLSQWIYNFGHPVRLPQYIKKVYDFRIQLVIPYRVRKDIFYFEFSGLHNRILFIFILR